MVEHPEDRFKGLGQVVKGGEEAHWINLIAAHALLDIEGVGSFTWQNYSQGALTRKARLDRSYVSADMGNAFMRCKASVDRTTCISDHYPIIAVLDNKVSKIRSSWFHTDAKLFELPRFKNRLRAFGILRSAPTNTQQERGQQR